MISRKPALLCSAFLVPAILSACGAADLVETTEAATQENLQSKAVEVVISDEELEDLFAKTNPEDPEWARDFRKALVVDHDYQPDDAALIEYRFLGLPNLPKPSKARDWKRELSPEFQSLRAAGPAHETKIYSEQNILVATNADLTPPKLTVSNTDTQHPVFTVGSVPNNAEVYFEIDSTASFSGRNLMRYPSLAPRTPIEDNTFRHSQSLQLFQARAKGWLSADEAFQLPVRISSFALGNEPDTSFEDFVQVAQLYGYGLNERDTVHEVFELVSRRVDHGSASTLRTPYETFIAGTNECGQVNDLFGSMIEVNGIRSRGISGFNPHVKTVLPGAGHSATEYVDASGEWRFADPYLHYLPESMSAADMAETPGRGPAIFKTPDNVIGEEGLDEDVNMSDLFRYRRYFDKASRQRIMTMAELGDNEDDYGRDWPLRPLAEDEALDILEDVPQETAIYVRARYIVSDICKLQVRKGCSDQKAVASPWTTTSFTVRPRDLLKAQAG